MAFLIDGVGPTVARTFTFPDANATILTSAAAVTPAQGGTGLTSYAVGDLPYASGATTLSKLADVAVGSVLVSGGVATAPAWSASPALTSLALGTSPASSGPLRVGNNQFITGRDTGSSNIPLIGVNTSNYVVIGDDGSVSNGVLLNQAWLKWGTTSGFPAFMRNGAGLDLKLADASALTFLNASELRLANTGSVFVRNAADSAYVQLFQLRTSDTIQVGNTGVPTKLTSSFGVPTDLANGDWWVEASGSSPARVVAIKARDGGATRTVASITY